MVDFDNESNHHLSQSIKPEVANLSQSDDLDQALREIAENAVDRVYRGAATFLASYNDLKLGEESNIDLNSEHADSLKLHREKLKNKK